MRTQLNNILKATALIMASLAITLTTSCDVHQWPDTPSSVPFHLKLNYETHLTEWEYVYDGTAITEVGYGETYDNTLPYGRIRYTVRAYPISNKQQVSTVHSHEFVFTKDIAQGYNCDTTLNLSPGNYKIMIWSDLIKVNTDSWFYKTDTFTEITFNGSHKGNTDYRDAFRGSSNITLIADIMEHTPDTLNVTMQRPIAKYEFITTDLQEFLKKEIEFLTKEAQTKGETIPTKVDTENYKVVFLYAPYVQNTYNMFSDKPIDVAEGVVIESRLNLISENNASLGFDYVFTNPSLTHVAVQIGFYDSKDREIALSNPINVPLQRSHHTILKGSFLMQKASGGITINPEFNGNHNIIIK